MKRVAAAKDRQSSDASTSEGWKDRRLKKFLVAHDQHDLAEQVPQILSRHRGRERQLFTKLEDKFGGSLNGEVYVHQDKFSARRHRQLEY